MWVSDRRFGKISEVELDEVESKVTILLGTATAETLEECFGEIQLQIPPSAVGKRSTLLRTLNRVGGLMDTPKPETFALCNLIDRSRDLTSLYLTRDP